MNDVSAITTERLRLEGLRLGTMEALLKGDLEEAGRVQQLAFTDEFKEELDDFFLGIQIARMTSNPDGLGWCARAIVNLADGVVLGHCGFHGPPEDVGRAEIGYTVLAPHRGQGYATEAALALVDYARERGVKTVFASVSPTNRPSLSVVRKLGFRQTGLELDDIDGEEAVFELDL